MRHLFGTFVSWTILWSLFSHVAADTRGDRDSLTNRLLNVTGFEYTTAHLERHENGEKLLLRISESPLALLVHFLVSRNLQKAIS